MVAFFCVFSARRPVLQDFHHFLSTFAKNCRNRPGSAYYEEVSAALQEGVTSVLMGEQSIDNAVATIQAKEEEIYNR